VIQAERERDTEGNRDPTDSPASFRLWTSADRSSGSSTTELTFPAYHWVENPCQVVSERPSLKEKATAKAKMPLSDFTDDLEIECV
jgi:hypothetical protein